MKIERKFGEYFDYSLHDARILKIDYVDENLILHFDYIFSYNKDKTENTHKAKIIFEKVDLECVDFLVFNDVINENFSGKKIDLEEYQKEYKSSEFEVIIETYNWSRGVLQGWLWTGNVPVDCVMNIFYYGRMIYEIAE
ncbi:hypothetical protein HCQ94_03160 [Actinomyces sp. zg-332]|uniref:hypothetical protein n=1 Tax=Actinomyces sp. zg-332 TaxID=2708340 RepID=UPI0014224DE0|nr:hypothetical protein [Actinomyces sp. zg-332]QPK93607.1 hypothetical protein HCQ94_03160 [Actinomyces sp. zg-332]